MKDNRLESLKRVAGLLNAEAQGDQLAKERLDQMISRVVEKIDAVANEGGLLEDACTKHGLPLCLFARPYRSHFSTMPVDRRLLNEGANAASPSNDNDRKDNDEHS